MNKRLRPTITISCLLLLFVATVGLLLWRAKRQYMINRQLITALEHHDAKRALALIHAGADPNTRYNPLPAPTFKTLLNQLLHRSLVSDDDSPTALMMLCGARWRLEEDGSYGHLYLLNASQLVQSMLVHGARLEARTESKNTALLCAVESDRADLAEILVKHGANANVQDAGGRTPLMQAILNQNMNMVRLLLTYKADVNAHDFRGDTALFFSVRYGTNIDFLRQLLAHGVDVSQRDSSGNTALTEAQEVGRPDIILLLRKDIK